jgi:hypothetical protein
MLWSYVCLTQDMLLCMPTHTVAWESEYLWNRIAYQYWAADGPTPLDSTQTRNANTTPAWLGVDFILYNGAYNVLFARSRPAHLKDRCYVVLLGASLLVSSAVLIVLLNACWLLLYRESLSRIKPFCLRLSSSEFSSTPFCCQVFCFHLSFQGTSCTMTRDVGPASLIV